MLEVGHQGPPAPGPALYLDLASPEAWLAAERALQVMPVATEWIPVRARELSGDRADPVDRAAIAARAAELGLQPVRWPDPFPFDGELALLAATFAGAIGRVVAFCLAAFRQAYAGGHALSHEDHVLIAAAACEMHPAAVRRALATRATREALAAATALAAARGVRRVPAVWLPDASGDGPGRVFHGERELERAAAAAPAAA